MLFKIIYSGGEIVCGKGDLLSTAERELEADAVDVIKLISFMATSTRGSEVDLSIGKLVRLDDSESVEDKSISRKENVK